MFVIAFKHADLFLYLQRQAAHRQTVHFSRSAALPFSYLVPCNTCPVLQPHTQPLSPAHPSSPKSWTGAGSDTQSCWCNGFHCFLVLTAFVTLVCLLFPNSTLGAGECASEEANFKNPRVPSGLLVAWVIPTTAHWWAVFLKRPHRKVANSTDVEV